MRLRIFGVARGKLLAAGLLPVVLWFVFHPYSLLYRTEEVYWVLGTGILVSLGFTALFRRGWFASRHWVYAFSIGVLANELIRSVLRRDFMAMGAGILGLGVLIGIGRWIERRVASASLNPQCLWFEGEPLLMNQVEAAVQIGEESFPARLRRMDTEGMFLFVDPSISFRENQRVGVWLRSGAIEVEGEARIRASFEGEKMGLGLQFLVQDLYHFSRYTELVQQLRGRGL